MICRKLAEQRGRVENSDSGGGSSKPVPLLSLALFFLIAFFFLAGFLPTILSADTIYFPRGNRTLQDAVSMAAPGDTIIVAPGTYQFFYETLNINNEFLILRSSHGREQTILLGRGKGPVVRFAQGSKAVLDGFTITSVENRRVVDLNGGAIYCAPESAPVIINNRITGNEAVFGGGIYCDTLSAPTINSNYITKNRATVSGGGIFSFRSAATISNNWFVQNEAENSGGAIGTIRDSSRMNNNIIWRNRAGFGGGVSCDRSTSIVANNTIVQNAADYGGGIAVDRGAVRLTNLVLWHNTRDDLSLKQVAPSARPSSSLIGDGSLRGINGNISVDPMFVDVEKGDFQLRHGSPCIDTGSVDPFYEDADGSVNDMGAYGGPDLSLIIKENFLDKD